MAGARAPVKENGERSKKKKKGRNKKRRNISLWGECSQKEKVNTKRLGRKFPERDEKKRDRIEKKGGGNGRQKLETNQSG